MLARADNFEVAEIHAGAIVAAMVDVVALRNEGYEVLIKEASHLPAATIPIKRRVAELLAAAPAPAAIRLKIDLLDDAVALEGRVHYARDYRILPWRSTPAFT